MVAEGDGVVVGVVATVVLNALVGTVVAVEVTGAVVALNVVGAGVVLEVAVCSMVSETPPSDGSMITTGATSITTCGKP